MFHAKTAANNFSVKQLFQKLPVKMLVGKSVSNKVNNSLLVYSNYTSLPCSNTCTYLRGGISAPIHAIDLRVSGGEDIDIQNFKG